MDDSWSSIFIKLATVALLVLTNGFFVGSEFALVSVRPSRIETLVAEGNKRAKIVQRILKNLTSYISATQFGVTLASLALGWIGEDTMAHLLEPLLNKLLPQSIVEVAAHGAAVTLAFASITYFHIVLGELVPKAISLEKAESVAMFVARPLNLFYRVFKAPIWLLNRSGVFVLRALGLKATPEHTAVYSEEELRHLVALSEKSGHLIEDERKLIDNVFEFTEATVESIMIPRTEIEALDEKMPPAEMLAAFERIGYSRMPVYRDSLDEIIGILLYKDLSRAARLGETIILEKLLRPAVFLPGSVKLNDALARLKRSSAHMALIVDEHGGIEGLVTLEDLLEEIVGDISDEHDEIAAKQIQELGDGSHRVSGSLTIKEANRALDLGLPESDSYNTIAGFMMARAGSLMSEGESVEYNGLRLTVQEAARNRIVEARVERVQ